MCINSHQTILNVTTQYNDKAQCLNTSGTYECIMLTASTDRQRFFHFYSVCTVTVALLSANIQSP